MGSNHPMGACASALPRTAMSPWLNASWIQPQKAIRSPLFCCCRWHRVLRPRVRSMWNGDGRGVLQHLA